MTLQKFLCKNKWAILALGAAIQILTGIPAAWGVFRKPLAEEFGFSDTSGTTIFSFIIAFFGIGCVIGGFLQDKKGPRVAGIVGSILLGGGFVASAFLPQQSTILFCTVYCMPVGLGCAFLYPAVMSTAQNWYADKKGLATGIIGGAVGASGAALTFLGRYFIKLWGIRGAFFTLGIIIFIVSIIGSCLLQNPKDCKVKTDTKEKNYTIKQMIKTPQYWLLFSIACLATPAVLLFSPIIVELGQQRGLSESAALSCIVIGSVFSAAGRLLMPWLSDKIGRRYTDMILFAALAGLSAWFIFAQKYIVVLVYSLLTFCYSAEAAVLPATASDLFGKKSSGVNYGFVALGMTLGSLAFPIISRLFSSEIFSHIIAIAASALGFLAALLLKPTQGKRL